MHGLKSREYGICFIPGLLNEYKGSNVNVYYYDALSILGASGQNYEKLPEQLLEHPVLCEQLKTTETSARNTLSNIPVYVQGYDDKARLILVTAESISKERMEQFTGLKLESLN